MYYAMLAIAALLLAADFSINKVYQKIFGSDPPAALLFNCLLGWGAASVFFAANGFSLSVTPYSLCMAGR